MKSRLVNVRLHEEHVQKVRALRRKGVVLADLVRDAITKRFDELNAPRTGHAVRAAIAKIFERYPDAPGLPARSYEVHDRRQARAAIRRALRGRGR